MSKVLKLICLISLIISDIVALLVSFLIAYFLRSQIIPLIISGFEQKPVPLVIQLKYGFSYGAIIIIFIFAIEKLYIKRFFFWDETKHLLKAITLSFILLIMMVFISKRYTQFSRVVIILTCLISLIIFPLFRLVVKKFLMKINLSKKKIIILGTNGIAKLVAQEIKKNKILGYEVIGFLTDKKKKIGKELAGFKIIGEINDFERLSNNLGINDVIIALPTVSQRKLIKIIEQCEKRAEIIRIIPSGGNLFTMGVEIDSFGDILCLSIARNLVKPWNIFIKNLFEFFLVLMLIIPLLPIFLIIALAIKIDSPGPILFIQERLGERNKTFRLFKFRSMYIDGDRRLEKYLKENPKVQKEWDKYQKIKKNDPRVTRAGKFIRKYSLDEIPQLINFFKRDMNLVGPRPYLPREIKKIGESHQIISRVKPSVTGMWQVGGRNLLSFRERLLLDEHYIRNWSLWLDMVILFKTIKVLITREGAY